MAPRDISGETFFDLTAVRPTGGRRLRSPEWLCRCICGKEKLASYNQLTTGNTKSCGCRIARVNAARNIANTKHGHAKTYAQSRTYKSWCSMMRRCYNKDAEQYIDYGGRGISVCERWHDFVNFLADMGERPPKTTIERKGVDGNYEPDNCVWASSKVQTRNKRNTRRLTMNGRTQSLSDWADEVGLKPNCLRMRLENGWTVDRSLTTPQEPRKPRKK